MGSPGAFIHSGILGGRLFVSAAALSASPPASTAPPIRAPLPRRKRRRDVTAGSKAVSKAGSSSRSVGSVIVHSRQKPHMRYPTKCPTSLSPPDVFPGGIFSRQLLDSGEIGTRRPPRKGGTRRCQTRVETGRRRRKEQGF